jgi:2-polyprenyl-3-methyl-5-hydroxy-6-metoxy-1,4-benzoquinol methylase
LRGANIWEDGMARENLKALDSHFKFGDNWASYAAQIDETAVADAERGLERLVPGNGLRGKTFLDIGCGSGIHALAAMRLGARRVLAVDIDPRSVEMARALLSANAPHSDWRAETRSIFEMGSADVGRFDVVYSWGVLHHTGDMWTSVERGAALVSPEGLFVIALYRTTQMDWFWKQEKRIYAHSPRWAQRIAQLVYIGARQLAHGRYQSDRGMDYRHDVHDWLGGYPYETATPAEVDEKLRAWGFARERTFTRPAGMGVFGSGCDEFVYRKA